LIESILLKDGSEFNHTSVYMLH